MWWTYCINMSLKTLCTGSESSRYHQHHLSVSLRYKTQVFSCFKELFVYFKEGVWMYRGPVVFCSYPPRCSEACCCKEAYAISWIPPPPCDQNVTFLMIPMHHVRSAPLLERIQIISDNLIAKQAGFVIMAPINFTQVTIVWLDHKNGYAAGAACT